MSVIWAHPRKEGQCFCEGAATATPVPERVRVCSGKELRKELCSCKMDKGGNGDLSRATGGEGLSKIRNERLLDNGCTAKPH